jgi:outer membrane protein W
MAHPLLFVNAAMKVFAPATIFCALLLTTFSALAQGEETPHPPVVEPPPPPAASGNLSCRLAEHSGIEEADATTAGQLVCIEVARAGAAPGDHYRVALGRLGSIIILSVAREGETPGSTADSRELRLHGIEEVSVAAPRVAAALVHGTSLQETETVNNIVNDEARPTTSKPAKAHFALGLIGTLPPFDRSATPAPGVSLELHAETNPFEIVGNFRFGGDSSDGQNVGVAWAALSIGGRYFMTDSDFSPYVGAGFSWTYLSLTDRSGGSDQFDGSRSGLGGFAEAGLEILRTRHTHLAFGARLDLPFFSLNNSGYFPTDASGAAPPHLTSLYYAPVSVELRLTF